VKKRRSGKKPWYRYLLPDTKHILNALTQFAVVTVLAATLALGSFALQKDKLGWITTVGAETLNDQNAIFVNITGRTSKGFTLPDEPPQLRSKSGRPVIVGSNNPWQPMVSALLQMETPTTQIVVYGEHPGYVDEAIRRLHRLGFKNVVRLDEKLLRQQPN
jgi:hypothetical protein